MRSFQDRIAVVTGAGSGIGAHTAIALAKKGCHLAISDIDLTGLEATAAEIRTLGRHVSTHEVDAGSREAIAAFAEAVVAEHGGVNILVNNAGVSLTVPFADTDLADLDWIVDINLWGVVNGCHFFLPHLLAAEEGHIVNLSSLFGIIGVPEQTAYCLCKAAVRGFTESLDMELEGTQVGVTCVHPGAVATGILRNGRWRTDLDEAHSSKMIDRGMHPSRAAALIVDAIAVDRSRLMIGNDAKAIDLLQRMFPTLYRRAVHYVTERQKRKSAQRV